MLKRLAMALSVFAMFLGLTGKSFAQGEAALPFLLLAPDSRAAGIGESGSGLADNASAIFWNPAGIAFLDGTEFSFTHSKWLPQFNLDLFYDYLAYRQYIEEIDGSLLASVMYMNYGEFVRTDSNDPTPKGTFRSYDMAVTVGYATKLSNDFGLGLNFRLIHSQLADKPTGQEKGKGVATTVSFDIAGMWRPEKLDLPLLGDCGNKFSLGINLSNLGPKISYIDQAQADPIPTNFRLGMAFRLYEDEYNSLTWSLDFSKLLVSKGEAYRGDENDTLRNTSGKKDEFYKAIFTAWGDQPFDEELRDIVTSTGFEYWYGIPEDFMFALRGGFFYEDPSYGNRKFLTFGAGIRYDMYGFDFSYISTSAFKDGENHPLADTLRFSLLIGWGTTPSAVSGFPRGI